MPQRFSELATTFFQVAHHNLKAAMDLYKAEDFDECVIFCQKAGEKGAKALLAMEKEIISGYKTSDKLKTIFESKMDTEKLEEIVKAVELLESTHKIADEPIEKQGKIVNPIELFDKHTAKMHLDLSINLLKLVQNVLKIEYVNKRFDEDE